MHTVQRLELAIRLAKQLGMLVRMEWLGGSGGGACQIRGQRHLFIDLGQSHADQLATVLDAVAGDPQIESGQLQIPSELIDATTREAA